MKDIIVLIWGYTWEYYVNMKKYFTRELKQLNNLKKNKGWLNSFSLLNNRVEIIIQAPDFKK